jgi:hypothetical protein
MTDKESNPPPTQPPTLTLDAAKSAYWHASANGFMGFFSNLHSTWYGQEALHYRFERETLSRYVQPFYWGIGATVLLFINFRVTGSARFLKKRQEWLNQRRPQQQQQPQTPATKPSNTKSKSEKEWTSHLEKHRNEKEENAMRSIKSLTDILVSLSLGTTSILLLLDGEKETMRQDFEQAPLTMGRSLVADRMCHEMMQTSKQFASLPASSDDANFVTFTQIVANCQLRQEEESKIRNDRGMTSEEPVSIPFPGLGHLSKPNR